MKRTFVRSVTLFADRRTWIAYAALAILTAYNRMIWPFLIFTLFLVYLMWSCLWTALSCRRLTVADTLTQTNLFAGDTFKLEYRFQNTWGFPLVRCGLHVCLPAVFACNGNDCLRLVREEPQPSAAASSDILTPAWVSGTAQYTWIPAKKAQSVKLEVCASLRGCYYLPFAQVFAGDPSGLFQGFSQTGREHFLTVMPKLSGDAEVHKVLSFEENLREDIFGLDDPYQAMGVRDYQTNDSPKDINWYATARSTTVKTNLYQRRISASCLVVLDLTSGFEPVVEPAGEREEDPLLENAISLACGIALSQLARGTKTAFYTNAPTLHWEKLSRDIPPGSHGVQQRRSRHITALDFASGSQQERSILDLCASIDDTSRANAVAQRLLWEKMRGIPAGTMVYLLCYHTPPRNWQALMNLERETPIIDPAGFYNPSRLAALAFSRLKVVDLSKRAAEQ